ncbi:hypothetical protein BDP27DRAFT_1316421 [Rhodocollybia butyracea]|uniref:Uncharacterized protein n=1 Tax=Rhodocollybia butyracea TaxID=206335 RepID=A0A9P5Q6K3_9AGAR|nr:hypothetical protein BDP27DRAFT_1316421 [Rhodocollybia butyracea]
MCQGILALRKPIMLTTLVVCHSGNTSKSASLACRKCRGRVELCHGLRTSSSTATCHSQGHASMPSTSTFDSFLPIPDAVAQLSIGDTGTLPLPLHYHDPGLSIHNRVVQTCFGPNASLVHSLRSRLGLRWTPYGAVRVATKGFLQIEKIGYRMAHGLPDTHF